MISKPIKLKAALDLTVHWVYKSCLCLCLTACKVFIMVVFLIVSAAVFLCPLVICSPCITSNLPPKPALVGHRGAPMVCWNVFRVEYILVFVKHMFALAGCLLSRVVVEVWDECDMPQTELFAIVSQSILGLWSLWHLYSSCRVLTCDSLTCELGCDSSSCWFTHECRKHWQKCAITNYTKKY